MESLTLQSIKIAMDSLSGKELTELNSSLSKLISERNNQAFKYRIWASFKKSFHEYDIDVTCFKYDHYIVSLSLNEAFIKFEKSPGNIHQYHTGCEIWKYKDKPNYNKIVKCFQNVSTLKDIWNMHDAISYSTTVEFVNDSS